MEQVKAFNEERGWNKPERLKENLLNLHEEISELWTVIKWVDTNTQQQLIEEHKAEVASALGDMYYLLQSVSDVCHVNLEDALTKALASYQERYPLSESKDSHSNVRANGIDKKYQ